MTNEDDDEDCLVINGVRENLDHNIGSATCPKCKDSIAFVYYQEVGLEMLFPDSRMWGIEAFNCYICPRCRELLTTHHKEAIALLNGKAIPVADFE